MEKIKKSSDIQKSNFPARSKSLPQQEAAKSLISQQPFFSALTKKNKFNKENIRNLFNLNIEKKLLFRKQMSIDENMIHDISKFDYNKVLLKFSKTNLVIEDSNTNLLVVKLNYKKFLSFNNSMLNERYFYLAYKDESNMENKENKIILFHSTDSSLIDDLIKEFASNFMNITNSIDQKRQQTPQILINDELLNKRTCQYCPLQQYVQLCDYLNELLLMNKHEKIYLTLNKILDNVNEKEFIRKLCDEFETDPTRALSLVNHNIDELNQLLCSFIYKICYFKQLQHLHLKQETTIDENFNILNYIYDIDKVDESDKDKKLSMTNEETLENLSKNNNNNFNCLKRKFDNKNAQLLGLQDIKSDNKAIKLRKERLSLGNIYSKSNLSPSAINFYKKELFNNNKSHNYNSNYNSNTLNLKRKSSTFDGIDKSLNQHLLSISYLSNNYIEPLVTCFTEQQQEIKEQLHTELTQLQSTQMYKNQSKRRSIFNKVIASPNAPNENTFTSSSNLYATRRRSAIPLFEYDSNDKIIFNRFKTREDIRKFWRKIISEQILLIKMDYENKKFKAKIAENIPRRRERQNMAFLFKEIESSDLSVDLSRSWKELMEKGDNVNKNSSSITSAPVLVTSNEDFENFLINFNEEVYEIADLDKIRKLLLKGVPNESRDTIWLWLSKQYLIRNYKQIQKNKKNLNLKYDLSYNELLKDNTTHQHAIMIDLGRTFPMHPNFSQKFSAGQLALFNVLKAYSILDPDVGYCQGLSFIVGILLIHCDNDEEKAFEFLKHLLINLGLRKQFRPDMLALQKYMYIVTRLLYDYEADLYQHLEDNEASAQLYCTPWFLTLFSSQFEMAFAVRVFDFLFAEGPIIIFKIALSIFNVHQALLMHCDSFEVILNYLKITVPGMSLMQTESILNKAFNYDIERDIDAYETEFYIFQEEVQICTSATTGDENMKVFQLPPSVILNSNNSFITQKNDERRLSTIQKSEERRLSSSALPSRRASNSSTLASLTRRTSNLPSPEKRGSAISLISNNTQISQLENINSRLKERIEDLLEQLRVFQSSKNSHDDLVYKLQHENKQLKCKIETLEIERLSLLNQLKNDDRF